MNDTELPIDQDFPADEAGDQHDARRVIPAWIISLIAHVLVLGLLSLIVYAAKQDLEEPPVKAATLPHPPEVEERIDRSLHPVEMSLDITVESEKPSPVSQLDAPMEQFSREDQHEAELANGREEAIADAETGGEGAMIAIGASSGASGIFGSRIGVGKRHALADGGGTRGSESAVDAALRWFKKHQSPNGQWDVDGYPVNCAEAPKCEPGAQNTAEDGDIAATSYAILCYLGAGHDHRTSSRYRVTVKKGLDWLLSVQRAGGEFGRRNYEQGIAVMALSEAYAMTNDPALKEPAQKGVDHLLSRQVQDQDYPLGWGYEGAQSSRTRLDASVSGWCVMALKSAAAGGLNVGTGMDGAKQYLERAWKACNKDFVPSDPYTDETTFPYTWNPETDAVMVERGSQVHHDMAPVGALMAVFLQSKQDDPMLNSLANYIMKHQFPTGYPCNTYYMYYNTLAIFMVGGDRWKKWNDTGRDLLVDAQRKDGGCFNGSWDWQGTLFPHNEIGRIFSTAYCCLSLEVYYRYGKH
jgi:hypothetical protein